jgi:hypothetical protein
MMPSCRLSLSEQRALEQETDEQRLRLDFAIASVKQAWTT